MEPCLASSTQLLGAARSPIGLRALSRWSRQHTKNGFTHNSRNSPNIGGRFGTPASFTSANFAEKRYPILGVCGEVGQNDLRLKTRICDAAYRLCLLPCRFTKASSCN